MIRVLRVSEKNPIMILIKKMFFLLITFGGGLITILSLNGLRGIDTYYTIIGISSFFYLMLFCRYKGKVIYITLTFLSIIMQYIYIKSGSWHTFNYDMFIQFYSEIAIILCVIDSKFIQELKQYIINNKIIISIIYMSLFIYYLILFVTKKGFNLQWSGMYFQAFYWFPHQTSYVLLYLEIMDVILYTVIKKGILKKVFLIVAIVTSLMNLSTGARTSALISIGFCTYCVMKELKGKYITTLFYAVIIAELILVNINNNIIDVSHLSIVEKFQYSSKVDTVLLGSRTYIWEKLIYDFENVFTISDKIFGVGFGISNYINISYGNGNLWSHNDFLEVLLSGGIYTLSIYIAVFARAIWRYKCYLFLGLCALLAYFNGFFSYLFLAQGLPLVVILSSNIKNSRINMKKESKNCYGCVGNCTNI